MKGRCWSRLERPDPGLRRGGGGGGATALPVLSLDARRRLLRFEAVDDVRFIPGSGNGGSPSRVLLREDGPCDESVVRTEVERWGNSFEDELALDAPISDSRAPCLEGGGGGGDFTLAVVVALLATSPGVGTTPGAGASTECCDDSVSEELLLDLFSTDECRSWLCLRARGTGGGALFCCREFVRLSDSPSPSAGGDVLLVSEVSICSGWDDRTGVGGSGLFVSDVVRGLATGDGAASVAAKLSKDTVCGCRGVTILPWRCAGAGGGFLLDLVLSGARLGD